MLTSKDGMMVRVPVKDIRIQGRSTMGVTIMKLNEGDKVVSVAKIVESEEDEENFASEKEWFFYILYYELTELYIRRWNFTFI